MSRIHSPEIHQEVRPKDTISFFLLFLVEIEAGVFGFSFEGPNDAYLVQANGMLNIDPTAESGWLTLKNGPFVSILDT